MSSFNLRDSVTKDEYIATLEDAFRKAVEAIKTMQLGGFTVAFKGVTVRMFDSDPAHDALVELWQLDDRLHRRSDFAAKLNEFPRLLARFIEEHNATGGGSDAPVPTGEEQLPSWLDYETAKRLENYLRDMNDPSYQDAKLGASLLASTLKNYYDIGLNDNSDW